MKLRLLAILLLCVTVTYAANPVKDKVDRLFTQASSGEIRYRSVVQPSKDSLIAMGDSAARYLALKLNSTDARERHTLVDIYRGIGKVATPYLLKALKTENKDQLRTTSWALGDIKDSTAVDALAKVAKHPDYTVRSQAIESIGKCGGGLKSARIVTPYLHDPVFLPRKSAVAALGRLQQPQSIPDLIKALSDEHFAVRLTASLWLARYDTLAYDAIAEEILAAPDERTRALALRLAGELKIARATEVIKSFMRDPDPDLRGWSIWSLIRVTADTTRHYQRVVLVPMLMNWQTSEQDPFVRSMLQQSLDYLDTLTTD